MKIRRLSFGKDPNVSVSVVIPTTKENVMPLQSIEKLLGMSPVSLEVIMVRSLRPQLENRTGRGKSRNVGAEMARGNILLFVDDDIAFHPSDFKKAVDMLLTTKNVITGLIYTEPWAGLPTIGTRFLALKKVDFKDIGRFNETICGVEDWEFSMRALVKGYRLVSSAPNVEHYHERTSRELLFRNIIREMHGTLVIMTYAKYLRDTLLRWFFPLLVGDRALKNDLWRNGLTRGVIRLMSFYYWSIRNILTASQKHILNIHDVRE